MENIEVIKFGSSLVANKDGIDRVRINQHVEKLAAKERLIIVVSGAVATGRAIFEEHSGQGLLDTLENQKLLAGIGATTVFHTFEEALRGRGRLVASHAITHKDLDSDDFIAALQGYLRLGVVTVLNEADAINSTELMELKTGGDNDGLAGHVARTIGAKALTIVTEQGGVFDDTKHLVEEIRVSDKTRICTMLGERCTKSSTGRGGINTKVSACFDVLDNDIEASITDENGRLTTRFMVG